MKSLLSEYGKALVYVITGILCIGLVWGFIWGENGFTEAATEVMSEEINKSDRPKADNNETYLTKSRPTLDMNQNIRLNQGETFDALSTPGVKAVDGTTNADIIGKVQVFGTVCDKEFKGDVSSSRTTVCNKPGLYTLRYSIRDSSGFYVTKNIQVIVDPVF